MDVLIGSGVAAFVMYAAAKWNKSDKDKIQHTFKNVGYSIGEKTPRLFKTHKTETSTLYTYHVPYGLIDDSKLDVLEKVLNRPIKISFVNGKLHIRVHNEKLKDNYHYSLFSPKGNWTIPVGMMQEGVIYHDFEKLPHMIVSGSTTWGKTVFMRMLMTHLIENNPDSVEFYVLDLKGGLAFHRYSDLKQVKSVASDYRESYRALAEVEKRIKKDMNDFKKIYAENAKEAGAPTRKFIIIDEAGELVPDKTMSDDDIEYTKGCQRVMSRIARVAGQLGYKMIFGTQYPTAEILNNQIKANSLARVSFRLSTAVQSGVAIDQDGAEQLEHPGQAIYKTVDEHIVQTPFISKDEIWERLCKYNDDSTGEKTAETRTDFIEFG